MANVDAATLCRPGKTSAATIGSQSVVSPLKNPIKSGLKTRLADDRGIEWAIAVNSARIRAPRRVLDVVFGHVPGPAAGS